MGSRPACLRPRPVFLEAKAKAKSLRGQGQGQQCARPRPRPLAFEAKAKASSVQGQGQAHWPSRPRPRPRFFVHELSSRSRTVLEDPISDICIFSSILMNACTLFAGIEVNFAELNNVHIPAAMLKSFLRQLPEPLLTFELYDHIVHVQCRCRVSHLFCQILCNSDVQQLS